MTLQEIMANPVLEMRRFRRRETRGMTSFHAKTRSPKQREELVEARIEASLKMNELDERIKRELPKP